MNDGIVTISLICLLGAVGTWLLLPLKHGAWARRWGDTASRLYAGIACAAAGVAIATPIITAAGRGLTSTGRIGLAIGLGGALAAIGFALGSMRWVRNTPFGIIGGVVLSAIALAFFASTWNPPGAAVQNVFFYLLAAMALIGGLLTITSRNPVHSALWFASVVLSTSGLFLLAGAQFLAAGTIIVYAGAIIVTFLFVIMLAQSEGQAVYDRKARAPGAAALAGFGLAWATFFAILAAGNGSTPADRLVGAAGPALPGSGAAIVLDRAISPTARLGPGGKTSPHVAGLGATLFTDHLLAVEIGGALLFVALVGAISMATPRPPIRPADRSNIAAGDVAQARNLAESPV